MTVRAVLDAGMNSLKTSWSHLSSILIFLNSNPIHENDRFLISAWLLTVERSPTLQNNLLNF